MHFRAASQNTGWTVESQIATVDIPKGFHSVLLPSLSEDVWEGDSVTQQLNR